MPFCCVVPVVTCAGSWGLAGRPCRRRKSRRSTPPSSLSCGGATSARTAASRTTARRPGIRSQPYTFYMARSTAASGRRPTPAARGTPIFDDQPTGSIGVDRRRAVRSERHLRRQRRRACSARTSRPATASTSRPTPAGPGRTSACATRSRSRTSPSIRGTRIGCSSRRSAIPTVRTRSAASSARPTAARRSRRSSTRTRTPAATTSTSIRRTPTSSTRRCGKSGRGRGRTRVWAGHRRRHLQVDRRRHDLEAADEGTAGRSSRRTSRSRRRIPSALYAAVAGIDKPGPSSSARHRRHLSQRRRRRDLDADHDRSAADRPDRRRRPADADRCTRRIPTRSIIASTVSWKSTDGGKTLGAVQGRARRRRLPERLDQSRQPRHHAARRRSGRGRHAQRRRDVELLVQPADGAVLPRHRPTTRFRIASAAGSRRADRSASSSRGNDGAITFRDWLPVGVDEYGYVAPDPLNPDIVYGGHGDALRSADRPGVRRRSGRADAAAVARRAGQLPSGAHDAGGLLRGRQARRCSSPTTISGRPSTAAHSWKQISPDLTRKTWERPEERRQVSGDCRRRSRPSAASSTPSRRRTRTSTASGSAPTTA